jgi:light-independent protochlorophyllide reductase subunit B
MFRDDFEFCDTAKPSHLGGHAKHEPTTQTATHAAVEPMIQAPTSAASAPAADEGAKIIPLWQPDAERELKKIPFFVRGKARRNTEAFATERGLRQISLETLYDAKAHFGR